MAHIGIVIAPRLFQDKEYQVSKQILESAGHRVTVMSTQQTCVGKFGTRVEADEYISDADPTGYDALVLIGGPGAPALAENRDMLDLLRTARDAGLLLCAICIAPTILVKAGLLEGCRATVYPDPDAIALLHRSHVIYVQQPVIQDGRYVTADGPQSTEAFGKAIVSLLAGR